MAIDFPNSPSNGDIHTVSGKRWQWDGEKWQAYGASLAPDVLYVDQGNARVGINDTTPTYSLDVTGTAHVTGAITASGGVAGALTGNADTATEATNITAVANNSTDETVYPAFVDGATGTQGIETDTGLTYNPSTGLLTAAGFSGPLTGNVTGNASGTAATVTTAAQSAITSVGTLTGLTVGGAVTVGVNDAGHDVKLFGDTDTAYMLWDASADELIVDGAGTGGGSGGMTVQTTVTDGGAHVQIANDAQAWKWLVNGSIQDSMVLRDQTSGVNRFAFTTGGSLGIGVTAPETPLHIVAANTLGSTFTGTTRGEGLLVEQSNYSAGNYVSLLESSYDDSRSNPHVRIGAMFDGGGAHLAFGTSNNFGNGITNTAMFIDEVGKVGIGTTGPVGNLTVKSQDVQVSIIDGGSSGRGQMRIHDTDSISSFAEMGYNAASHRFSTSNTHRMEITSAGNVGIGTTTPALKLHVYTTASTDGILLDGSTFPAITLQGAGTTRGYIGVATGNGGFVNNSVTGDLIIRSDSTKLHLATSQTAASMTFSGTNVGIGDTSPTEKLDVAGDIRVNSTGTYPVTVGEGNTKNSTGVVAFGYNALDANTGSWNIGIGFSALGANTSGNLNTAVGNYCLDGNATGTHNTAVGHAALSHPTNIAGNVAVGFNACGNTQSSNNVGIGAYALDASNNTGSANTAVGYHSLGSTTLGAVNTAVGYYAGNSNTTGPHNVFIGYIAGRDTTTGGYNTIVGSQACDVMTGGENTAFGYEAGGLLTSGGANCLIGKRAGDTITTGGSQTMLGWHATGTTTGSNNTIIGYNTGPSNATVSNEFTLGNSSISNLRCQDVTISQVSDERDKTNIQDLDMGLDFICRLQPRRFEWNMRDGGKVGVEETGFIAQELQQAMVDEGKVIPGLVRDDNPDKLEAAPMALFTTLVKAIQELSAKVDALT